MEESPRERAISSEPCSGRPNPFDDVTEQTSRKRQRVSSGGSRSRSVDTARDSDTLSGSMLLREEIPKAEPHQDPSTPPRVASEQPPVEPTSSRVTINLRTNRPLESIPSSPPFPTTPSKMARGGHDTGTRISVESESDALSTIPAMETPSSSPSESGSPQVELVQEDDADFEAEPPVAAIINSDDEEDLTYNDPMLSFPYYSDGEALTSTVNRVSRYFHYDAVDTDEAFCKLRDWIDSFLALNASMELFYDTYVKNREFWLQLPDIVWGLSFRTRWFGEFLRRSRDGRQALTDMLNQFARLAGKFVAMDVRTMKNYIKAGNDDQDPDLGSRNYIGMFAHLSKKDDNGSHIGKNLEMHYQWNYDADIALFCDSFQRQGGDITALTKLVHFQLRLVPRSLKNIEMFTNSSQIVQRFVEDSIKILRTNEIPQQPGGMDAARNNIVQGYGFFKIMAPGLNAIVEKHVTLLPPDAANLNLRYLREILESSIMLDNKIVDDFLDDINQEHLGAITKKFSPKVVSTQWKFGMLKKLITSSQMQLRVVGVTAMCADLLALHGAYKFGDVTSSPILLYFANFVLENKLVDYLVGIGSHPEIINESSNILGFLIVTKTYKQAQSDKIWQTVTTSQDPRVVEAILRMVMRCFNLFDARSLIYLCKKAANVPIEAFSPTMREFCSQLFSELSKKPFTDGMPYLPAPPYELCIRLLRESSVVSQEHPAGNHEIQTFAAVKLRELLQGGPVAETRNQIYLDCIMDISAKSPTATGSICVINALLRQNMGTDLRFLTTQHGLTQLLVDELEATIGNDSALPTQPTKSTPASQARRDLILSIIVNEPETITPDLGTRLWNVLVGSQSRTAAERSIWWQTLNSALKTSSNNAYLSVCIREHLPKLPPHCFNTGALDFAREAVSLWLSEVQYNFIEEDKEFESYALEQIWRMILTAPPNTIEAPAITILVEIYVDSKLIKFLPRTNAKSIHLAFVGRCLDQLKGAANKLKEYSDGASSGSDESMIIVASEVQFQEQEKIFARSLAVLRAFLGAYQQKPVFATPRPRPSALPTSSTVESVEGEPLTVKYQSFDGDKQTDVQTLTLGRQNTAASLLASLQKATGFKSYKVYCGGQEFDPDEKELCKSLDDLNLNGLLLVKRGEDGAGIPGQANNSKTSLELEIMRHFDDLWSYLSMHEKVAQEIYSFLTGFPVYDQLLQSFNADTSHLEIFPNGQPFKSLYAVHAIREYISSQSPKAAPDEAALARAISLIVAAISDPDVLGNCATDDVKNQLASDMIECLVGLLNKPILPSSVPEILNDNLLKRLLQLLNEARSMETSQNSVKVTGGAFQALLDAAIHNAELWHKLISHLRTNSLLQEIILHDPRPLIRKSIVKQIVDKCNSFTSLAQVSSTNFVVAFWPMVSSLIPQVSQWPYQSEELLLVALTLLKKLADIGPEHLKLEDLVRQWGVLLLSHQCQEKIGHPESIDIVAHGLTNLLAKAVSSVKAAEQTLSCSSLGSQLFRRHLFPELSVEDSKSESPIEPRIPLLNHKTRQILSETVLSLVKNNEADYAAVLSSMTDLVPYDSKVLDGPPYSYDLVWQFERAKSIRSSTGYVGLKNLSNTCYLNSLFTQLFMNIPFREFMLQAHVADGGASQKLLSETQNLFSYMQNSLKRFVDPTNLASSIRTYEETQIDVTIQMDVDEFYNLLFDRWESQILAPDAKRKFRSFYGGQLVQQVKSKECSHISERLEPFAAIQCDIKGKSCLQESLQAYVDGEIMEGDNKYKCSTCDRHVDAVKRACLKDIPDNLIFHLKRFDFNLRTLQRNKINDHFSFPSKIDMKPYKVEHLMDSPEETPEDMFELVGILVHSGTAESGHYYSFVRERPSNGDKESWVEFNDESVTPWDPNCMEGSCFGGIDYRGPVDSGNMHYDKSWSAYMLFYQRSSVVAEQKALLDRSGLQSPVRLPVPLGISNHIAMENELLMRKYCLYDPSHSAFVEKMLKNIKEINKGQCSSSHRLEKRALTTSLHHLDQVIARTKDLPDFDSFMKVREEVCSACAECSRDYLEWFCDNPETLRQLLLRNPDTQVRKDIELSILEALMKVKQDAPYAYGLGYNEESDDETDEDSPSLFPRVVQAVNNLWDIFHTNCRAWPEYFGLLADIAKMGKREAVFLLGVSFLRKTLDVISADSLLPIGNQYSRMLNIISKRMVNRPVSYEEVIELLCSLIEACDPSAEPCLDMEDRSEMLDDGDPVPFSLTERNLLMQHWTRNLAHILTEKLLSINQNRKATETIIIHLLSWPESIDENIFQAIIHGIRRGSPSGVCIPFLQAAVLYIEYSRNPKAAFAILSHVSKIAQHLDNGDGRVFIDFFRTTLNKAEARLGVDHMELIQFLLDQISVWGPGMLTYYEAGVRTDAEELMNEILINPFNDNWANASPTDTEGLALMYRAAVQKLGVACLNYLHDVHVRPRQTAVRATMVNIQVIIEDCAKAFDSEARDGPSRRFFEHQQNVTNAIKKLLVEEADDEVSDWDGSEEYEGSSEPMEGVGEMLSGNLAEDIEL